MQGVAKHPGFLPPRNGTVTRVVDPPRKNTFSRLKSRDEDLGAMSKSDTQSWRNAMKVNPLKAKQKEPLPLVRHADRALFIQNLDIFKLLILAYPRYADSILKDAVEMVGTEMTKRDELRGTMDSDEQRLGGTEEMLGWLSREVSWSILLGSMALLLDMISDSSRVEESKESLKYAALVHTRRAFRSAGGKLALIGVAVGVLVRLRNIQVIRRGEADYLCPNMLFLPMYWRDTTYDFIHHSKSTSYGPPVKKLPSGRQNTRSMSQSVTARSYKAFFTAYSCPLNDDSVRHREDDRTRSSHRALYHACIILHLLESDFPLREDTLSLIAQEMNSLKPRIRRAFCALAGNVLWSSETLDTPAWLAFAAAVLLSFESSLKTVSNNPNTGAFEGYIVVVVLLGPLVQAGKFDESVARNTVIQAVTSSSAKPSFVLSERVYQKLTESEDELWDLRAIEAVIRFFSQEISTNDAIRSNGSSADIRRDMNGAIELSASKFPELTSDLAAFDGQAPSLFLPTVVFQSRNERFLEALIVAHHELICAPARQTWIDLCQRAGTDPHDIVNSHVDRLLYLVSTNTFSEGFGFKEASYRAVTTLAFVSPESVVPQDANAINGLSEDDLGIWATPEGTTYVDGESYHRLARPWKPEKAKTLISPANNKTSSPTLTKQQQALVSAQLEKESLQWRRVQSVKINLEHRLHFVRSLVRAGIPQFSAFISNWPSDVRNVWTCSGRSIVPEELQAEALNSLVMRVLHRLRYLSEQSLFNPATFSYIFPLIRHVLAQGGVCTEDGEENEEQLALALPTIKFHCGEFADLDYPREQTLEILILTTRQQPKLSREASSALIDLSEAIYRTASKSKVDILLQGTLLEEAYVQNSCLQSLQGMVIVHSLDRSDPWPSRVATASTFKLLSQVEPFFKFLIQDEALGDHEPDVRQGMLSAGTTIIDLHGALCISSLIVMFEGHFGSPNLSRHSKLRPNNLIEDLANGSKYAARRGAAYGLAGVINGTGIAAGMKEFNVINHLQAATEDKKRYEPRQGMMFAFETLSSSLGRLLNLRWCWWFLFSNKVYVRVVRIPRRRKLRPISLRIITDGAYCTRATAAKALGTLVERLGEGCLPDLVPGLLWTLKTDTSGVDRQGASQGLSEVLSGLGMERLEGLLPDIIANAQSPRATVRERFMSLWPMTAGRMIITNYSNRAIDLLLCELEHGMFDPGWRIRQSSITLVGELMFKVSGMSGKTCDLDEEDVADVSTAENSRRALSCSSAVDKNLEGEQYSPDSPRDTSQTDQSNNCSFEQQETSGHTIAELCRKLGEKIVGEIMAILLKVKVTSTNSRTREGVCLVLSAIMENFTDAQREDHEDDIISIVRVSLVDDQANVRSAEAKALDMLQEHMRPKAIDETIPTLLEALRQPGESFGTSLQALKEVMNVRAATLIPVLIPTLTATPMTMFNAHALASLVTVAGNALSKRLTVITSAFVKVIEDEKDEELLSSADEATRALFWSINDIEGLNTLMILGRSVEARYPQTAKVLLHLLSLYRVDWIRQLISAMEDDYEDVYANPFPKTNLNRSWSPWGGVSSLQVLVPVIIAGLTTGSNEQREQAAYAIDHLVELATQTAILSALTSMLKRIPAFVKPFYPQLQRTFVKGVSDPASIVVRNKAAKALGVLMKSQPRVDAVVTELIAGAKSNFDDGIGSSAVVALAHVVRSAKENVGERAREACVDLAIDAYRGSSDESYMQAIASLVAALTIFPDNLQPVVDSPLLLTCPAEAQHVHPSGSRAAHPVHPLVLRPTSISHKAGSLGYRTVRPGKGPLYKCEL
ncbi:ARM repeat-containing protein [Guyanagaster necrorhizus]|uniref:ARM repeat-containing protein n=1 Tax=Guyanagaster necrorhizus TaxID=856835 RepID=A0A9P7VG84_9AGAR|nr:ARM repeat-containing protein [Guyanagaster necrorhizus MCA 3950]KAG7440398.1 ARM repeat-containing protein [Guyanagaster necrorhizus MCA 3950]